MRAYRGTLVLAGLVLLGWLGDAALGGGAAHAVGWVAALGAIGGVSGLTEWSRQRRPDTGSFENRPSAPGQSHSAAVVDHTVRPARPDELAELIEVEIAADRLFPLAGYGQMPGPAELADLHEAACILVSGDPAVGYARIEIVDGQAHLESLSVRPRFMRQGRGSALVRAALDWAAGQGYDRMTLTTFADVPWNGPFYRQLGFTELSQLGPGLAAARAAERELGLDGLGRRIAMVRRLETLAG